MRRKHLSTLIVLLALIPLTACGEAKLSSADNSRPNILLIVADDLGYADLGVMGSEIETPNIDSLARQGVLFTRFHTSNMCAPTRAMLLSGNNNHVAGMARQDSRGLGGNPFSGDGLAVQGYEAALSDRIVPFPYLLARSGYHTAMVGKWHLGFEPENSPQAAGFSRAWVMLDGAGAHFSGKGIVPGGASYRENGREVAWPENAYSTEFYTDKLIEYMSEGLDQGQPFFAFAAYTSPHWPLQVPDEYLDKYAGHYDAGYDALRAQRFEQLKAAGIIPAQATFPHRNPAIEPWDELSEQTRRIEERKMELYSAMVDNLDDHVGRLVDFLEQRGELDNTLIVFMGDNGAAGEDMLKTPFGDYLRQHYDLTYETMGRPGSFVAYGPQWAEAGSAPFSRYKGYTRQGGIVAPLIMAGAGVTQADLPDAAYITVMDLAPTFLQMAGVTYPDAKGIWPMHGRSMVDYLAGREEELHGEEEVTVMFHWGRALLRQGDWKLVTLENAFDGNSFDEADFELYNLAVDPGETRNLAELEPEKFDQMLALWRTERRRVGIVLPQDL